MANLANLMVNIGLDSSDLESGAEGVTSRVESKFENLGPAIKGAAKAAGVAAGAAIVAGAVIGMEREKLNDKLAASLALSEGDAHQAGVVAGKAFATGITDSRSEVSTAVGSIIGELGGIEEATPDLVTNALAFADVFDTDVQESVGRAGVLLRSDLVDDGEEAFDLLTAGMQEVAPSLRDELMDATQEYSRFFSDLGLSGQEMYGLLADADDKFELDKTGDAIKELSVRATDGSTRTEEAFDSMGLDAGEMSDDILAGGDKARGAFDKIVNGLLEMESPSERAKTAVSLFGVPLEDMSSAQIPEFLGGLQDMDGGLKGVEGSANDMTEQLGDNAQTKIQGFQNKITNLLSRVVEAPGIVGDAATAFGGIGAALGPVAPMLTGLAMVFDDQLAKMLSATSKKTVGMIKRITSWAVSTAVQGAKATASLAKAAGKFVAHYARMAVASMVNAAKMAASWIIAMGPIAWVIAGVVALAALIIANWDTIREYTKVVWEWVSEKIGAVWDWVSEKTSEAVTAVVDFVSDLKTDVTDYVQQIVDFIKEYHPIMILWRLAKEWVPKAVQKFLDLKDKAIEKVTALKDRASELAKTLWNKVSGFFGDLKNDAVESVAGLKDQAINRVTNLKDTMVNTASTIKTRVVDLFTGLKDGAVGKVEDLLAKVQDIKSTVTDFFSGAWSWLLQAGKNIVQGLIDGLTAKLASLRRAAERVAQAARDFLPFSPAKEGPLSGSGSPDKAGEALVDMLAQGMGKRIGNVSSMAERVAGAASPGVQVPDVAGVGGRESMTLVLDLGEGIRERLQLERDDQSREFRVVSRAG